MRHSTRYLFLELYFYLTAGLYLSVSVATGSGNRRIRPNYHSGPVDTWGKFKGNGWLRARRHPAIEPDPSTGSSARVPRGPLQDYDSAKAMGD